MTDLEEIKLQLERLHARLDMLQLQVQTDIRQVYRELGRHDARLENLEGGGGTQQ